MHALSAQAFQDMLQKNTLHVLLLDCGEHATFPGAISVRGGHLPRFELNLVLQCSDSTHVICFDDHGTMNGEAFRMAERIKSKGKTAYYLEPGMLHFLQMSPKLSTCMEPCAFPAIEQLKKRQAELASIVWSSQRGSDPPTEIIPYLYLGSEKAAHPEHIAQFNVGHVVRIGMAFLRTYNQHVKVHDFKVQDDPDEPLGLVLGSILDRIHKARQAQTNCLVHCQAGISRSATVVLAYLMRFEGMSLEAAFDHVFWKRPIIRPNRGFAQLLQSIETRLFHCKPSLPLHWIHMSYALYLKVLTLRLALDHMDQE